MKYVFSILVGAVLGFTVGIVAHDSLFDGGNGGLESPKSRGAQSESDGGSEREARRESNEGDRGAEVVDGRPRNRMSEPTAAAATVTPKSGDGEISGVVARVGDGTPVAGLLLKIVPTEGSYVKIDDGIPFDEWLTTTSQTEQRRRSMITRTTTDNSGRFTFSGLDSTTTWMIQLDQTGWKFDPRSNRSLRGVKMGSELQLSVEPVSIVSWRVLRVDGTEVDDAAVRFVQDRASRSVAADKIGLSPGQYTVTATYGEYERLSSEPLEITVEEARNLDIVLELTNQRTVIAVDIIDKRLPAEREAARGPSRLYALPIVARNSPDEIRPIRRSDPAAPFHSDFAPAVFLGLAPGRWRLTFDPDDKVDADFVDVELVDVVETQIVIRPAESRDIVDVTLLGPAGEKIEQADFEVRVNFEDRNERLHVTATSLGQGSWKVAHKCEAEAERKQLHRLAATAKEWGTVSAEFTPGIDSSLRLQFSRPATLTVAASGPCLADTVFRVRSKGAMYSNYRGWHEWSDFTRMPSGEFEKKGLVPGPITLIGIVEVEGDSRNVFEREIVLVPGGNRVVASLPNLYTLTLVIPDGVDPGSIRIDLRGSPLSVSGRKPERIGGNLVYRKLPPQEYTIATGRRRTQTIKLDSDQTVTLDYAELTAYRVKGVGEDSQSAKAGFREGDLIVGADGARFTSEKDVSNAIGKTYSSTTPTKVMVLRNGEVIELEITANLLRDDLNYRLDPAQQ